MTLSAVTVPSQRAGSRSWSRGKRSNAADLLVARRLLAARREAGLSQEAAAKGLGVTFQQLQKYERGFNRVSAGRLAALASLYGKPVGWFFDASDTAASDLGVEFIAAGGADLARAFLAITSTHARRLLVDLAEQFAAMERK